MDVETLLHGAETLWEVREREAWVCGKEYIEAVASPQFYCESKTSPRKHSGNRGDGYTVFKYTYCTRLYT